MMVRRVSCALLAPFCTLSTGSLLSPQWTRRDALYCALSAATVGTSVPAFADDDVVTAIFSAGDPRFLQPSFDDLKYRGVKEAQVGTVSSADGEVPAIRVSYNPKKLSYKRLLGAFWRSCDPTRTAAQGQFGVPGPTIIWVSDEEMRSAAERSRKRLTFATQFTSSTSGPMFRGQPILTEIRSLSGDWTIGSETDQSWYLNQPKEYEKARKKTGRTKWFEDAYKPVTVSACQGKAQGLEGTLCGFVYFPCSEENGCEDTMNGNF